MVSPEKYPIVWHNYKKKGEPPLQYYLLRAEAQGSFFFSEMVSFRYHGNYAGPGWSEGKMQGSVRYSSVPAVDAFDETARIHDIAYATPGADLKAADYRFYRANWGKGFKRSLAAAAVGFQGYLRAGKSFPKKTVAGMVRTRRGARSRAPSLTPAYSRSRSAGRPGTKIVRRARSRTVSLPSRLRSRSRSRSVAPSGARSLRTVTFGSYARGGSMSARNSISQGRTVRGKRVRHGKSLVTYGVMKTREFGSTVSAAEGVYIGHCTCPELQMLEVFCYALVKAMLVRTGEDVADTSNPLKTFAGDIVRINYRTGWDAADALLQHDYTCVGNDTFDDIKDNIYSFMLGTWAEQYNLRDIEYLPLVGGTSVANYVRVPLRNARVHFKCKSSLKMQNRSVEDVGDDMDAVDTIPVIGRSYQGKGTGTDYTAGTNAAEPFVANRDNGVIAKNASGNLREPPKPQFFSNVTNSAGIHMESGQLKTSNLSYTRVMSIHMFTNILFAAVSTAKTHKFKGTGVYRFFGLEKQLDAGAGDTGSVTIAYEHNLSIQMAVFPVRNTYTAPLFETN